MRKCFPRAKKCFIRQKHVRVYSQDNFTEDRLNRQLLLENMEIKMNKQTSRAIYNKRFSNVEPVFSHITWVRGFKRFTVWGKAKVKAQWLFVCFVHNIYKIMKYSRFARQMA